MIDKIYENYQEDVILPKKGGVVEINSFLNKNNLQKASELFLRPMLFIYLATMGNWQLFGKQVLPFIVKNLNNDFFNPFFRGTGDRDKTVAGQFIVGSGLAFQIAGIFALIDGVQCLYDSFGENVLGFQKKEVDQYISEALQRYQKEINEKIKDAVQKGEINQTDGKIILNNCQDLYQKIWNSGMAQKFRNTIFQGMEDGAAGFAEVAGGHYYPGGENAAIRSNIPTLIAPIPETIRSIYNAVTEDNKQLKNVGSTVVHDNRAYLDRVISVLANSGPAMVDNLQAKAIKAVLAIPRGAARGVHFAAFNYFFSVLGLKRGDLISEAIFQATRNSFTGQQLPWQFGDYALSYLMGSKKDYKIMDDLEKGYSSSQNQLQFIAKQSVKEALELTKRNLNTMLNVVSSIQDVGRYYNAADKQLPETPSLIHLRKIIEYETAICGHGLSDAEKNQIQENVSVLCQNAKSAYITYSEIIKLLIDKIDKTNDSKEINKIFNEASSIMDESKKRFNGLFPTGIINDKKYKKLEIDPTSLIDVVKRKATSFHVENETLLMQNRPRRTHDVRNGNLNKHEELNSLIPLNTENKVNWTENKIRGNQAENIIRGAGSKRYPIRYKNTDSSQVII